MGAIRLARVLAVLAVGLWVPTMAFAQGSITGTVKDSSGAVLPGVTVEASSPVLIEKVRTVFTDDTGQYRVIGLRPGTYAVRFILAGFKTFERSGVELTGSFTALVNAGVLQRMSDRQFVRRGPVRSASRRGDRHGVALSLLFGRRHDGRANPHHDRHDQENRW